MKKLTIFLSLLCLTAILMVPTSALEYTIAAPGEPDYGKATSVEPVITADGGAMKNEDVSKNAALAPPAFGSPSADTLGTGNYLTPNLAPETMVGAGEIIEGNSSMIVPPAVGETGSVYVPGASTVTTSTVYSGEQFGELTILSLGVKVNVYQGTDSASLAKGAGHFENSAVWTGNVCLTAHNRGVNSYFGTIHTLKSGDIIILTTAQGTRTYSVTSVSKISEMDSSMLASTTDNCITLFTCVRDQSAYRWCVRGVEV